MLKIVMDVAAEQFAFAPLLIILLLAAVALRDRGLRAPLPPKGAAKWLGWPSS